MRKARGQIYAKPGIFHLESELHADQPKFTKAQAELYEKWLCGLTQIYGFDLLYWQFHASGFSVIVETCKAPKPPSSKLAEGFKIIGEATLSAHVIAPRKSPLNRSDALRLTRFLKHHQDTMEFAKGLKQRISRQHNETNASRGTIWADRMRFYRLPNRAHDLVEVAAFIDATPKLLGQKSSRNWPGSHRPVNIDEAIAKRGLKRIFRNRLSHKENLHALIERSAGTIHTISAYQQKKTKGTGRRGRPVQWRPECETEEQQDGLKPDYDSASHKNRNKAAKRRFEQMLRRFLNFKEETGEAAIPHGYKEDPELRTWACQQRGLYKAGRLTQWKIDLLKNSGLLHPPVSGTSYVSTDGTHRITPSWMARYEELQSFYEAHGHSRVTRRHQGYKTLANWVWLQRSKRRDAQLLPQQIALLDEIEFQWNPRSRT